MKKLIAITAFTFLLFSPTLITLASCGSITGPEESPMSIEIVTVAITDCANPFAITTDLASPYLLMFNGAEVSDGSSISIPESGETNIKVVGVPLSSGYWSMLYKHEGDNYQYIDLTSPEPTYTDMQQYISVYFSTPEEQNLYAKILQVDNDTGETDPYFYDSETHEEILDSTTGEPVEYRFWDFYDSFYDYYDNQSVQLTPGTYTMVFKEYLLTLVDNDSWLERLRSFFIPTAYAACRYCAPPNTYTTTFTLLPYTPTPTGASSILFLPGIQASHLYTRNILGNEDELWVPNNNGDIRQLAMTALGESKNDIYTREIIDSVRGLGSVYSGISNYFDTLVEEDKIAGWEAYAYDWRYAVDDIVTKGTLHEIERKYVLDLVESMAGTSNTGKVSLVGHSNGGLLAKVIVSELEKNGKANLIDQVVLLASPQTGTPKAIGSLLHGYGQDILGGLILRADTAREVIKNLPGAYALLPTKEYFEDTNGSPVVVFEDVESTKTFVDAYGSQIADVNTLHNFMAGRGEERGEVQSVYEPIIANHDILVDTTNLHTNVLQSWRAPESIKVTEVAGIGLPTIHSFAYRSYMKREPGCVSLICPLKLHYQPVPRMSLLGDETVMTSSAVGYRGDKESYYFDLNTYKDNFTLKRHYNFTEAEPVHKLLSNILLSATNTTPFIKKVSPAVATPYLMMGVHSPATAVITDSVGRQLKVEYEGDFIKKLEDIPGSYIYYFGETTYILLPKDGNYHISLQGTGAGAVTLELEDVGEGSSSTQSILIGTVSSSTTMTTTLSDAILSDMLVDEDGDGSDDILIDAKTNQVVKIDKSSDNGQEVEVTVPKRSGGGYTVKSRTPNPAVAGVQISLSTEDAHWERLWNLYELLVELRRLLILYEKII